MPTSSNMNEPASAFHNNTKTFTSHIQQNRFMQQSAWDPETTRKQIIHKKPGISVNTTIQIMRTKRRKLYSNSTTKFSNKKKI